MPYFAMATIVAWAPAVKAIPVPVRGTFAIVADGGGWFLPGQGADSSPVAAETERPV